MPKLCPGGRYDAPLTSVVIVHRGESPTADIYLTAPLSDATVPVTRHDIAAPPSRDAEAAFPAGSFVVVVRYLDAATLRMLHSRRHALAGVAYLLDDDIPGAWRCRELPLSYRRQLTLFWLRFGRAIMDLASELWLCSDGLEEEYGGAPGCRRIDPALHRLGAEAQVTIFYHGEGSHRRDTLWLREVVGRVQAQRRDTLFEIFGGIPVKRAFRGVPRCRIVHPMTWGAYLPYASAMRFDIGLAPLLEGRFNRSRSFNKIHDVARCGAVGIYARSGPYAGVVEDGTSGILCDASPEAWAEAIVALAADPVRRRRMQAAAQTLAERLSAAQSANPVFDRFRSKD